MNRFEIALGKKSRTKTAQTPKPLREELLFLRNAYTAAVKGKRGVALAEANAVFITDMKTMRDTVQISSQAFEIMVRDISREQTTVPDWSDFSGRRPAVRSTPSCSSSRWGGSSSPSCGSSRTTTPARRSTPSCGSSSSRSSRC